MKNLFKALVAVCAMSMTSGVSATVIASFDFEDGNTTGWSTSSITTAPLGERFLGEFLNQTVSYSRSGIEEYDELSVTFDFYAIRSWDGNGRGEFNQYGPDTFSFSLNGQTLLSETFCANGPGCGPGLEYEPSFTGEPIAVNALGYTYDGRPDDAIYRFTFTTDEYSSDLSLSFTGSGLQFLADESWGLDNVIIQTSVASEVPEPTTTALLALGLFGVGAVARRRKLN
jgi:hypothetical protein